MALNRPPLRNRTYQHVQMQHPKPWQVPRSRDDFIRAARMDGAGKSHRAIGAEFGVSRQRASVMVAKGRAIMQGEQIDAFSEYPKGAVPVVNQKGTGETGNDRPAAPAL